MFFFFLSCNILFDLILQAGQSLLKPQLVNIALFRVVISSSPLEETL